MSQLFETLSLTGTKPAILSLIAPYSDDYVPRSLLGTSPAIEITSATTVH